VDASFTGRPSRAHDVLAVQARVLAWLLKPVGGMLGTVPRSIPLITDGVPRMPFTRGLAARHSEFDGMPVWTFTPPNPSGRVVVAVHGGAYVGRATFFHWWTYTDMARDTGATVVVPDYTLSPAGTAETEVPRTADFLSASGRVSVLGDSAGGGLALLAVQELVRRGAPNPSRLVLLAPWLDVAVSDPRSAVVDDPLLDVTNMVAYGRLWAGGLPTDHPRVSPLYGSLEGLPPTVVYASSRDRLVIDALRLRESALAQGVSNVTFRLRAGLLHDYAMYAPLPDARAECANLYADLGL
jgi:triacylglycerol lipase